MLTSWRTKITAFQSHNPCRALLLPPTAATTCCYCCYCCCYVLPPRPPQRTYSLYISIHALTILHLHAQNLLLHPTQIHLRITYEHTKCAFRVFLLIYKLLWTSKETSIKFGGLEPNTTPTIPSSHYYLGSLLLWWDLLKCLRRLPTD